MSKVTLKQKYFKTKDGSIVVINHHYAKKAVKNTWKAFLEFPYAGRVYSEKHLSKSGHMSGLWDKNGRFVIREGKKKQALDIVKKSSKKAFKKYIALVDQYNAEIFKKYVVKVG